MTRLVRLFEAGVQNRPTKAPKKRRKFGHQHPKLSEPEWDEDAESDAAFGASVGAQDASWMDDKDGEEDELGPDMDYKDPAEPDYSDAEFDRMFGSRQAPEPKPEPKQTPFASRSEPPSKALRGGKTGVTLSGDKKTLGALQRALESVRTKDDDLADWIDDCVSAISRGMKAGGDVELPKFEATPGLDDFDEDDSGDDGED